MIYITGDTHRDFDRVERFCTEMNTIADDVLIILGDAGINYFGEPRDRYLKQRLAKLPITLFCVHGNHEMRPSTITTYHTAEWHGGQVYVEDDFPTLLFAMDGEIYDLDGQRVVVIGGAFSVDWAYRVLRRWGWWADEQPSDAIKTRVEERLAGADWKVDVVLSHTVPFKYVPVETFIAGIDQSSVDTGTEEWLDTIEGRLTYRRWFAGHYHTEKTVDRLRIIFNDILAFPETIGCADQALNK